MPLSEEAVRHLRSLVNDEMQREHNASSGSDAIARRVLDRFGTNDVQSRTATGSTSITNPSTRGSGGIDILGAQVEQGPAIADALARGGIDRERASAEAGPMITEIIAEIEAHRQSVARARQAMARDRAALYLGKQIGPLKTKVLEDGTYRHTQRYEFGRLRFLDGTIHVPPPAEPFYAADVWIAAIKCFGTEDPGGEDEPYLVASVINGGQAALLRQPSVRNAGPFKWEGVTAKSVFGYDTFLFDNVVVGEHGFTIKVSLFEGEWGSAEQVKREIDKWAQAASADTEKALEVFEQGGAAKEAVKVADQSSVGDLLVGVVRDALAGALDDDVLGEKNYRIPAGLLRDWVDNDTTADSGLVYDPRELSPAVDTNFPREYIYDGRWLFSAGGGSYKVYLMVIPKRIVTDY